MPKRKFPFEDCCNHMRQLKMHVSQPTSFETTMQSAGGSWPLFNGSAAPHPSALGAFPSTSSPSPPSIVDKKIQLFVNFSGQLCRTSAVAMPSTPIPANVAVPSIRCHSCSRPVVSECRCHFCEKTVCTSCIQSCINCNEEFCVLCSVKIYRAKEDITLCLSCS